MLKRHRPLRICHEVDGLLVDSEREAHDQIDVMARRSAGEEQRGKGKRPAAKRTERVSEVRATGQGRKRINGYNLLQKLSLLKNDQCTEAPRPIINLVQGSFRSRADSIRNHAVEQSRGNYNHVFLASAATTLIASQSQLVVNIIQTPPGSRA